MDTKKSMTALLVGALFTSAAWAAEPQLNKDVDSYAGRDPAKREAGAARDEARRGILARGENTSEFDRNKFARCEKHSGEDRDLCMRRMSGEGTVSGSVEGGGLYRELRIQTPAPQ
jgi:hypothetical protein